MDFIACSLRNFKISDYSGPIEIKHNNSMVFVLLYKEQILSSIPTSYNYVLSFGVDEVNRLFNNVVCFQLADPSIDNRNKRQILINNLYVNCQMFSNALWFIKDNAITPYFATISSDCEIEPESLRRNVYYSDSQGKYGTNVLFTVSEIHEAMRWYKEIDKFTIKKKSKEIKIDEKAELVNMSRFMSFETSSFKRALDFLDTARKIEFLPAKIANYISVLECLFAVNGDNTHKTSERTAAFIGKNSEERIKIFKDVKKTYDIRSKYLHGSEMKESIQDTLPNISKIIDDIARKVMIKIMTDHPELNYRNKSVSGFKNTQEVNEWFDHLVLSKE